MRVAAIVDQVRTMMTVTETEAPDCRRRPESPMTVANRKPDDGGDPNTN